MNHKNIVLGIDTSAYTTSLAAVNKQGEVILDLKRTLTVPLGTRGLRQSDARNQHHQNLLEMELEIEQCFDIDQIGAIAVSDRPRPLQGSYMPVFMDGVEFGAKLANRLNIPIYYYSHQEGHIEAVKHFSPLKGPGRFLCFHLSGGTSELLLVEDEKVQIIGGSKDLSFGQLIDRVGVALGMGFPAGQQMDHFAYGKVSTSRWLKPIPIIGLEFNLSGIETQCQRRILEGVSPDDLIPELFNRISKCLCKVSNDACKKYHLQEILMVGGVSSSQTVRDYLSKNMNSGKTLFGAFSSDNAVGIALLGGNRLWL
jgi:N6-L-threonylcarbamoyladenine synthase